MEEKGGRGGGEGRRENKGSGEERREVGGGEQDEEGGWGVGGGLDGRRGWNTGENFFSVSGKGKKGTPAETKVASHYTGNNS